MTVWRGLVAVAMVSVLAGCDAASPGMASHGGDPTGWLGSATWVVTANVTGEQAGPLPRSLEFRLSDAELLYAHPVYSWLGERPAPEFSEVENECVALNGHRRGDRFEGQRLHLVLQATGDLDELLAGRRLDGECALGVLLILDEGWDLVAAGGGYGEVFAEVLGLYQPPGLDAVLELTSDARTEMAWSNHMLELERQGQIRREDPWPPPPPTPGPLGEWRRANGHESPSDTATEASRRS